MIFLYGEDTYRMKEKLKEIIDGYKKAGKTGLNLKFFDCEKEKGNVFKSLKDDLKQVSMFEEKKMAVISSPSADPHFKENLLKEKNFSTPDDILIFYQEGEIKKNDLLLKYFEKYAKCQKFETLTGQKLRNWVEKKFSEYSSKISGDAEGLLLDFIGNDLWRLSNEIQKLALCKKGKEVIKEDVKLLVRPKIETDIFKTIDSIGERDKKQALRLVHRHILKGDSPIYILAMINYQFRNLLTIKDLADKGIPYGEIAKKSGLHPFVVRKAFYQSQKFSRAELKKIYLNLFQVDLDIKTGKIEPGAGLENFILSC